MSDSSFLKGYLYCKVDNMVRDNVLYGAFCDEKQKKASEGDKMSTATCIPRRSPIQVLTGLNLA